MLLLIVFLFAVCQFPIHLYRLLRYWGHTFKGYLIVYQICDIFSFSNSWINVIIYAILNDKFKTEIVSVLKCKSRTPMNSIRPIAASTHTHTMETQDYSAGNQSTNRTGLGVDEQAKEIHSQTPNQLLLPTQHLSLD